MTEVVVSGIGIVSPHSAGREASWKAICSETSALRWANDLAGGPAPEPFHSTKEEPIIGMARFAAREAIEQAAIDLDAVDAHRIGTCIGTSKIGLRSYAQAHGAWVNQSEFPAGVWERCFPHAPAGEVAKLCGARGPLLTPVAACATGLVSLIRAAELIRDGNCDVVLAGSSDASLLPIVQASFSRLKLLSRADDPANACRPFHRNREGFLIGEGAAVLLFEREASARARGHRPLARWLGGRLGSDPAGITQLSESPDSLSFLLTALLHDCDLAPRDIGYLNLHGTATRSNDPVECRAIRMAFGSHAGEIPASSLKGSIGHLLGAAGSVETAMTILALRDRLLPPTLHLDDPDPVCDLRHIRHTQVAPRGAVAIKTSLGFGGHLAGAAFARW